jgi:hypothetical protein
MFLEPKWLVDIIQCYINQRKSKISSTDEVVLISHNVLTYAEHLNSISSRQIYEQKLIDGNAIINIC